MKLLLLFLGLCALALSEQEGGQQYKVADKAFLERQRRVLHLYNHINQPSHYKEHVEIANSFTINENVDQYTKPEVVKQFNQYQRYGLLPRGQIFSVFYVEHLEQAASLFKLFYYAKDFETFYKTAVWARQNVNEGLFLYSFSVAVAHRPDTYGIAFPPIYEIYPYYFYNTEVIQEAYKYKQTHREQHTGQQQGSYSGYTILANYSGHYLNLHPEQSLSYFLEDVGLNSFYYYYNLYYPFWLDGEEFGLKNDKRGELFYFVNQQLLARYYLERLSNDFGEIPYLDLELPVETPYYPSLQYPNGLEFPVRPAHARLQEYFYNYGQSWTSKGIYGYSYSFIRDYGRRIRDAIDRGFVYDREGQRINLTDSEGYNVLGNIIEGNRDSPNLKYFGSLQLVARHLLGYSYQPLDKYRVAPSSLEHFETSLRDPVFYQLLKRITLTFQRYQFQRPAYTEQELTFPGVKIENVEVDRLVTYFDYFDSDISNAVYDTDEELEHDTFHVRARQYRLNHRPFSIKVKIQSEKAVKASIKVFIGPKYDEYGRYINISENRLNFFEIEHAVRELKSGENTFDFNSYNFEYFGADRTTSDELYKQVVEAQEGKGEFRVTGEDSGFRYPRRLLLPKGSRGGTPYQIYVITYPYEPFNGKERQVGEYFYPRAGTGEIFADNAPIGYPFDRFIKYDELFERIPNSYFYEARVYHKHAEEINAPHH